MRTRYTQRRIAQFAPILVLLLVLCGAKALQSKPAADEINWQVIGSGATEGSNGSNVLLGTVGQVASGPSQNGTNDHNAGYWQVFQSAQVYCCGLYDAGNLTGNVDYDPSGTKDLTDILALASYAFLGGAVPPCLAEGNVDGDPGCVYDLNDVLGLASYAFLGGTDPAECDPSCE